MRKKNVIIKGGNSDVRRSALALLLGCLLLVAGVSAIDGYDYYQTIEYAGCDQETYQQDIVIHRTSGINYEETVAGMKIWHIYVGDHCQADYDDVRFTNSTGAELAYYLWPDYDSSSARFAVRLEEADSAGALTVWYGNPAASTTSDPDTVYDWFSDNLTKWSTTAIPYSGGTGTIDSDGGIHITSSNTGGISWPTVSALDLTGKRIEVLTTLNSHGSSPAQFRLQITDNISSDPGTANGVFHSRSDERCYFGISSTPVNTALPFDTTTPRKYAFTTTANAKLWIDDDLKLTLSNSVPNYSGKYLRIWVYYHAEATISYVLIRAYSATPPTASDFSGEIYAGYVRSYPGYNIPTDPDADGLYEDVNGNGRLDFQDIMIFFQYNAWAKANQPKVECWDWSGNGAIEFSDVQAFWEAEFT